MSREIKFRVWDKKEKKWIHGPNYECNLFGEMILMGGWMHGVNIERLNDMVALQYTGTKDKTGKEIYEGDIVNEHGAISEIIYSVPCFRQYSKKTNKVMAHIFSDKLYWVEIVGNIYETPELLK